MIPLQIAAVRELISHPEWEKLSRAVDQQREWVDQQHITMTEIPAPTFQEAVRGDYVAERFRLLGFSKVRKDEVGNVIAERPGSRAGTVALTAHLDTVFPLGTAVSVRRENGRLYAPGIADNGAGLAGLLGVAQALQQIPVATQRTLLLIANVGEEGEGDLLGMKHLFSRAEFRRKVGAVIALDGADTGHITGEGLGSRRFLLGLRGPGGHSWKDFGRVNPVQALGRIMTRFREIPLSANPRTVLNIGAIQGGTVVNSIPQSAWMKIDIRSTRAEEIDRVSLAAERAAGEGLQEENESGAGTLEMQWHRIGDRPAAPMSGEASLVGLVQQVDRGLGIRSRVQMSSTDANIPLSMGIEAVSIGGGGAGGDPHTLEEWYDPQGRDLGIKRILLIILAISGICAD